MSSLTLIERDTKLLHEWLNEICEHLDWEREIHAKNRSLIALRTVLQQLRDNLPIEVSAHLSAQLPLIVRGLYFENWHPASTPLKERRKDQFLLSVKENLMSRSHPEIDEELATKAVFQTLNNRISEEEAEKIKKMLPHHIRALWL